MGKFKVGDRVRSTCELFGPSATEVGIVRGFLDHTAAVVEFPGWQGGHDGVGGDYRGPDLASSAHWIPLDDLTLDAGSNDNWDYDPRKAGNDNTFKIEAGKSYRTREGEKVGPAVLNTNGIYVTSHPWRMDDTGLTYRSDGGFLRKGDGECGDDIVAEWSAAPAPVDDTPHIVAVFRSGVLRPSERHFVHADADSATAEAERLASLHPGEQFGVFALVAKRVGEVTVRAA